MFLLRKFALQFLLPLTGILLVILVVLHIAHQTIFSPDFYKNTLEQTGIYETIAEDKLGFLNTFFTTLDTPELVQAETEKSIDGIHAFIIGDNESVSDNFLVQQLGIEDSPALNSVRTIYETTKTILGVLYILVPILIIVTVWLAIKELVSLLKMVGTTVFIAGVSLIAIAVTRTLWLTAVIDWLVPDSLEWIDPATLSDAVEKLLTDVLNQMMTIGVVLTVLSLVVWGLMYWVRHRHDKAEHTPVQPQRDQSGAQSQYEDVPSDQGNNPPSAGPTQLR